MIKRTLEQMTDMLGVECVKVILTSAQRDIPIAGISTDTRTIRPGSLFVPLIGDHFDGHVIAKRHNLAFDDSWISVHKPLIVEVRDGKGV